MRKLLSQVMALLVLCLLLCGTAVAQDTVKTPWMVSSQPFGLLSMPELVRAPAADKRFFLKLTTGYQYDSNAILNAQGAGLPEGIAKEDDSRLMANLSARYLAYAGPKGDLSLNYAFFQSAHDQLDDFNLTQNQAEIAVRYHYSPRVTLRYSLAFQHLLLGTKLFDYAVTTGPSLVFRGDRGQSTRLDLGYRTTQYRNVSIFASNEIRTGENYSATLSHSAALSTTLLARLGYGIDRDETRSPLWDGTGHRLSAGLSVVLPHDSLFDLAADYARKDYDGVYASVGQKRTDNAWSAILTLSTRFEDRYGLSLRGLYLRNHSNVKAFDLSRFIAGVLLDVRF